MFDKVGKGYRSRKGHVEWLFRDFDCGLAPLTRTAILAPPGAGKTTLISLVAGSEYPSMGSVLRTSSTSWVFGSRVYLTGALTVRQNIRFLSDLYAADFVGLCEFVADFGEMTERNFDQELRFLPNERRQRLTVAAMLGIDFDFLLIDDDMNFGDQTFRRRTAKFLQDRLDRTGIFMATSDVALARRYCTRGGVLINGRIQMFADINEAIALFSPRGRRAA